jgi:16S rRNA (cytosine1402-N4)-methyltransferase
MVEEVIKNLDIKPGKWYVDATFGRGGHTRQILARQGNVIAFDHDQVAVEYGQVEFEEEISQGRLILIRENFNKLTDAFDKLKEKVEVSGILFDFGTSVDQLKDPNRGFSFDSDAELDMRMDDRLGVKAKDLLVLLSAKQLQTLFGELGGEEESKSIAEAIVKKRVKQPITTSKELAELVEKVKRHHPNHIHAATKVFQALRIAVNTELDNIEEALPQALRLLQPTGKLITISFNEGEDRIVKTIMKEWEENNQGTQEFKRPLQPTEVEIQKNKRSRSAKLRVFIKG